MKQDKIKQNTLNYYNKNAHFFADTTQKLDFSEVQNRFLNYLEPGAFILDFGCGAGRDTKYFLEHGFMVNAVDGAEELCRLASDYTGIKVKQMDFYDLSEQEVYDGVWACSSILHLPLQELKVVLLKIADSLKDHGVLYTSFKYGIFSGIRKERYFQDMTEEMLNKLLRELDTFQIEELWMTEDVRRGREEEKWLNVILRKK